MSTLKSTLAQRRKNDEGFTLIELMVVVMIIAVLLAIAIPTFLGSQNKAKDRSAQSSLRNTLTAAKTIYTDGSDYNGHDCHAEGREPSLTFVTAARLDAKTCPSPPRQRPSSTPPPSPPRARATTSRTTSPPGRLQQGRHAAVTAPLPCRRPCLHRHRLVDRPLAARHEAQGDPHGSPLRQRQRARSTTTSRSEEQCTC